MRTKNWIRKSKGLPPRTASPPPPQKPEESSEPVKDDQGAHSEGLNDQVTDMHKDLEASVPADASSSESLTVWDPNKALILFSEPTLPKIPSSDFVDLTEEPDTSNVTIPDVDETISSRLRKRKWQTSGRKQKKFKKPKVEMQSSSTHVPKDTSRRKSSEVDARYKLLLSKNHIDEVSITESNDKTVEKWITEAGLISSVSLPKCFDPELVLEFWANLPSISSKINVVHVFVRGFKYEFSPEKLNEFFGLPNVSESEEKDMLGDVDESVLALLFSNEGKDQLKDMTPAEDFSPAQRELFRLCCKNWMPTLNEAYVQPKRVLLMYQIINKLKFNLGRIIYRHIMHRSNTLESKFYLPHIRLIYSLMKYQNPIGVGGSVERPLTGQSKSFSKSAKASAGPSKKTKMKAGPSNSGNATSELARYKKFVISCLL